MHRARSCGQLVIEEVSWRLGLTLATCGYIILQSCTIIIVARTLRAAQRERHVSCDEVHTARPGQPQKW